MAASLPAPARATPVARRDRPDRTGTRRAQAWVEALRRGGDRDAGRSGVSDRLRVLAVAASCRPAVPELDRFIGLDNYIYVLRSHTWWKDVDNTLIITVFSVTIELVLGMLIAEAMYRALYARTWIRVAVLVPYGAVTVVSAFAWRWRSTRRLASSRHCSASRRRR